RAMLGTIARDHVLQLAERLAAADAAELLRHARSLEEWAPDYAQLLDELASLLARIALKQVVKDYDGDDLYAPEVLERLARAIPPEDVQLYYQTAIVGRRDLALAPDPRTGFEMVLLRMVAFRPEVGVGAVPPAVQGSRVPGPAALAGRPLAESGRPAGTARPELVRAEVGRPEPARAAGPAGSAAAGASSGAEDWAAIISALELTGLGRQL